MLKIEYFSYSLFTYDECQGHSIVTMTSLFTAYKVRCILMHITPDYKFCP